MRYHADSMDKPLRIIFMGTPEFAVPSLQALLDADPDTIGRVVGVVTQPDRPKGRGQQLAPPPIKVLAQQAGLPVLQPVKMKDPDFLDTLRGWAPDVIAVTAFGRILPPVLLDLPYWGCINVHGSLLPKYRGAAPIQWAIINGETETGITTMLMDPGLDTGPMLMRATVPIHPTDTAGDLAMRLAPLGGRLLVETIAGLKSKTLAPTPQDHAKATLAPLLKKEDGWLNWKDEAPALANRIRGLTPWPGAYTYHGEERWQIWRAQAVPVGCAEAAPGTILEVTKDALRIATGKGSLLIQEIQSASGKRLSVGQYLTGHRVAVGSRLTPSPSATS
jgi:methionyl-tRNA formyltransferase